MHLPSQTGESQVKTPQVRAKNSSLRPLIVSGIALHNLAALYENDLKMFKVMGRRCQQTLKSTLYFNEKIIKESYLLRFLQTLI